MTAGSSNLPTHLTYRKTPKFKQDQDAVGGQRVGKGLEEKPFGGRSLAHLHVGASRLDLPLRPTCLQTRAIEAVHAHRLGKSATAGVSGRLKQKDLNSHSARVRVPTQNLAGVEKVNSSHTGDPADHITRSHIFTPPGSRGVPAAGTGMKHILVLSPGARGQCATASQTPRTVHF